MRSRLRPAARWPRSRDRRTGQRMQLRRRLVPAARKAHAPSAPSARGSSTRPPRPPRRRRSRRGPAPGTASIRRRATAWCCSPRATTPDQDAGERRDGVGRGGARRASRPSPPRSPTSSSRASAAAIDLAPDLIISAGNDLVDPLALVTANHLDQQFLVVGAELAEPTANVTAADWTGASFRGEGLGMSSTYDPATFTPRARRARRPGRCRGRAQRPDRHRDLARLDAHADKPPNQTFSKGEGHKLKSSAVLPAMAA